MIKSAFPFLLALTALLVSCQKDEAADALPSSRPFPKVDARLWAYFERFEEEGALRGLDIDLVAEGIIGEIREIAEEHVAGQCTYGSFIDNHIIIDLSFWKSDVSDYTREMVVFHELGHCYLNRGHREDAHPNGACVSVMRSGAGSCFDNYREETRKEYLDELFEN